MILINGSEYNPSIDILINMLRLIFNFLGRRLSMTKLAAFIAVLSTSVVINADTLTLQNNNTYYGCTDTYIESCPIVDGGSNDTYDGTSMNHGDDTIFAVGAMRYNAG